MFDEKAQRRCHRVHLFFPREALFGFREGLLCRLMLALRCLVRCRCGLAVCDGLRSDVERLRRRDLSTELKRFAHSTQSGSSVC